MRRLMVAVGGGFVYKWDMSNLSATISAVPVTTTGDTAIVSAHAPGLAYDPVGRQFVAWSGGADVYTLNPDTWVWRKHTSTNSVVPTAAASQGTYSRWRYSPGHNVFVGVNSKYENVFIYKLSSSSPPPDPTPPSIPTNLAAAAVSSSQINLSWTASTDNVAVSGYNIYRAGSLIGTSITNSYANGGLNPGTTYTYNVAAYDAAGNLSGQSTSASATTQGFSADTTAPSVPTNLTATAVSSSQINLAWTASTDNVAVIGYRVFRGGVQIGTSTTNTYQNTGLTASTTYSYAVSAYDAAGNASSQSGSASATTQAAPGGGSASSFQITSTQSGTLPFTVGLGFRKGDIPGYPVLNIADYQVVVKRRWNDNSVKHAIAAGQTALTANVSKTIAVSNSASPPGGTPLTSANISSANPSVSVQLGAIGTVNLSSLLASPFRTWISGPEMVECHYRSNVGSDTSLSVWFHVRLYKAGRIWVRAIVENGYVGVSVDKSYVPSMTIGGTVVYNNGGGSLTHYANTRWCAEGWIGGDPSITPKHNSQYLIDTKLVPNYWKRNPSATALNGLGQTYVPMSNGNLTAHMGNAGYQDSIGLLPRWDALYVTSGDSRAYRSVLANSSSINSYPIVWRDQSTQLVVKPSSNPAALNSYGYSAGNLIWEMNHYPSEGYTAYLITGDYWHYESMLMNSAMSFMLLNGVGGRGSGVNCILTGETRGTAWNLRNLGQLGGLSPTGDAVAAEYQTLLANNMTQWKAVKDGLTAPAIGDLYEYGFPYGPGTVAPWQQHFFDQSVGMGSDVEPLADMTTYNQVRDFLYKWPVGILGDANGFYFNYASAYNAKIANGTDATPTNFHTTWLQVWNATVSGGIITGPVYDNTLKGASGSAPEAACFGYWGNLMPAIAYAVDHNAPGAAAAWARLTGATNWSVVGSSGFDDVPQWGIIPRTGGLLLTLFLPVPLPT